METGSFAIEGGMWVGIGVHVSLGVVEQQCQLHGRVQGLRQEGEDIQDWVSGKIDDHDRVKVNGKVDDHAVILFLQARLTET